MTSAARQAWRAHLAEDEEILWQGQPDQRLFLLRPRDAFLITFFLLWGGVPTFAILAEPSVVLLGVPLVFVIIGAYMLVGRFVVDGWRRRATAYLLTDRKAVIAQAWPTRRFRDVSLARGLEIALEGRSVRFGGMAPSTRSNRSMMGLAPDGMLFESLNQPESVFAQATRARDARG